MMDPQYLSAMLGVARELSVRGELRFPGLTVPLAGGMVTGFFLEEGADEGMLPGAIISSRCRLELANADGGWLPGGGILGSRCLPGAEASLEIGVGTAPALYAPCGAFTVAGASAAEGGGVITLTGEDRLARALAGAFTDSLAYPRTLAQVLAHILGQTGLVFTGAPACNGDAVIAARPRWGAGCTLRQALKHALQACGSFLRLSRDGVAEVLPARAADVALELRPAHYTRLEYGARAFLMTRVRVVPPGADDSPILACLPGALPEDGGNTLVITQNPLFRKGAPGLQAMADQLLYALQGMAYREAAVQWRGSPEARAGSRVRILDTRGETVDMVALRATLAFSGGMHGTLSSPADALRPARIMGARGGYGLGADGCVTGGMLAPRSIAGDRLASGAVDTDILRDGAVTADKIDDETIISGNIASGAVTQDKLAAGIGGSLDLSANATVTSLRNPFFALNADGLYGAGKEVAFQPGAFLVSACADPDTRFLETGEGGAAVCADRVAAAGISGNVPNTHSGAAIPWTGSIQASLNSVGKWLLQDTLLTVPAGTYTEDVSVRGFKGAKLSIRFSPGVTLQGTVSITACDHVYLYADAPDTAYIIARAPGNHAVSAVACVDITFYRLNVTGFRGRTGASDGTSYGLYIERSKAFVNSCCVDCTCARAIYFVQASVGYVSETRGGVSGGPYATVANLGYGVFSSSSHVAMNGACPRAAGGNGYFLGTLLGTPTPADSASTNGGGSIADTRAYPVSAGYWRKAETADAGPWTAGQPRQGWSWEFAQVQEGGATVQTKVYRRHYGVFYLAGAGGIVSDIPAGKAITAATLTLRRDPGGTPAAQALYLFRHSQAAYPGAFSPAVFTDTGVTADFLPGQERAIALDPATVAALNTGACRGFALDHGGTVVRWDVYGSLQVTYA